MERENNNEVSSSSSIKPKYYRNFAQSLSPKTLESYDYKLRRYMQYLGISASALSSINSSRKRKKTKPSSYNVPNYADIDYTKLIEGKSVTQIEDEISKFIEWQKDHHHASSSQSHYLSAISKFYSMNRIRLNSEWLSSFVSNDDVIIKTEQDLEQQEDRGYKREEISKLLEFCKSLRTRVMILLMASSGMRLGALPILKFGDLILVEKHQLYQIRVHTNSRTSRQYTFCTPECRKAIDNYLDNRRRDGERITKVSPLFRAEYNARDPFDAANNVKSISEPTVKRCISEVLYDSGLRTPLAIDPTIKLNNRRAVPMDHGFRRFFATWCHDSGMPDIEIKWCMGQSTGLEGRYIKPQPDSGIYAMVLEGHDKKAGYLDAIDWLTINAENRLKRENELLKVRKSEYEKLKEDLEHAKEIITYSTNQTKSTTERINELTRIVNSLSMKDKAKPANSH
jgi:integrase